MRRSITRIVLPLLILAAATPAFLLRLQPGDLAIVSWRGGGTPELRAGGISFRLPVLQLVRVYPRGQVEIHATVQSSSREGTRVDLPFSVKAQPDPQALLLLDREGAGGGAQAAIRKIAEDRLRKSAASTGTYDLASGSAAPSLVASLKAALEETVGPRVDAVLDGPILPPDVRASFERQALYGRRVETGIRVLLIGVDGADWDVIDPLIARGRLPNFARLKRTGAWARLRSSVPTLSPLLWTTVATGKTPDRHGINDFLVTDPRTGRPVPINATFRRTKAIWSILTEAGLSSDVIAWWATWPAEAIQGHLISDRVAYSTFNLSGAGQTRGAVHPPDYTQVVEGLRLKADAVTHDQVARFLHITPEDLRRARATVAAARAAAPASRQPIPEADESVDVMTRVIASTETYRRVALDLLDREARAAAPARLFAVYFQGVDEVNHRFAHCAPPSNPLCSERDYRRFQDAVGEFYVYQDGILGEILARAPGATVIVMSDHGFASGPGRPKEMKPYIEGKPGLWHDLTGIFIAAGPKVRRGEIPPVTLLDVAPTILYLLGLAVPEDMPGHVIEPALDEEFVRGHPVTHVPSYEGLGGPQNASQGGPAGPGQGGGTAPVDAAAEEEMREQLRALGYIGSSEAGEGSPPPATPPILSGGPPAMPGGGGGAGPEGGPGQPPQAGVPTLLYHTNLGAVYLSKKQYDQAEAEFRKGLQIDPASTAALSGLALLEESRGNPGKALEYLQRAVTQKSEADHPTVIKIAELFVRIGKAQDGLAYFKELEPGHDGGDLRELGLRVGYGMLYSALGRPRDAEKSLLRALVIDPAAVSAMQELFSLYDAQGRSAELQPMIERALRRNPRSAMHHNWLGLVLRRKGDLTGAEKEFRATLDSAPDLVGAMANLGSLYLQEGRPDDAVVVLQRALDKDPRSLESRTNLIVALGMKHDIDGARRLLKEAEGTGQKAPLLYNALAYALHVNGLNDEALETLRESLRIEPRQPDAERLREEIERGRPLGEVPYH